MLIANHKITNKQGANEMAPLVNALAASLVTRVGSLHLTLEKEN